MHICETCGTEVDPLSEPGIVYAVELELAHSRRGIEQLEGRGAFFQATCFPGESEQWLEKPIPADAYRGAG